MNRILLAAVLSSSLLSGCDLLGIESPEKIAAAKDADGRAIGAACRQSGRAIEDCYTLNKKADKAAMFAGWKDMSDYMRENKIAEVVPQLTPAGAPRPPAAAGSDDAKVADADDAAAVKASPKARPKPAKDAKEAKSTVEATSAGS